MILLGRPADALRFADKAFALADQRFGFALLQRCRAQMALGDYRAAIMACQKSTSGEDWWMPHAYLVAAYALLGDDANAKSEKAALLRLYPDISIARISAIRYSNVPEFLRQVEDHLYRGLRKAGIADTDAHNACRSGPEGSPRAVRVRSRFPCHSLAPNVSSLLTAASALLRTALRWSVAHACGRRCRSRNYRVFCSVPCGDGDRRPARRPAPRFRPS